VRTSLRYSIALFLMLAVNLPGQTRIYVDIDRGDDDGDGASWGTAKKYLRSAIALASDMDHEIWVAEGTYYPDEGSGAINNNKSSTFNIPDGVSVFGGFAGGEESLGDRDWEVNETILSGDIDGTPHDNSHNAYHVISMENVGEETVIDGFTITGGYAHGIVKNGGGIYNINGSPQIINCTIEDNNSGRNGGGVYNKANGGADANPTFTNCTITGNGSKNDGDITWEGGGLYNLADGSGAVITLTNCIISNNSGGYGGGLANRATNNGVVGYSLTNCTITGNYANKDGGGIYVKVKKSEHGIESNIELTNCTISSNRAARKGGGIFNHNGRPWNVYHANLISINTIIWGNHAEGNCEEGVGDCDNVYTNAYPGYASDSDWAHSIIEGSGGSDSWDGGFGNDEGNNMDEDPEFIEALDPNDAPSNDGNFHLSASSPAINSGYSDGLDLPEDDLDGNQRIQGVIDIGAYETYEEVEDEDAPVMVSICPDMEHCPDAISDYSESSDLLLTLNEEMMEGTGTIVIMRGDDEVQSIVVPINPLDANVEIQGEDNTIIRIDPDEDFETNTIYSVAIPSGTFEDASGNPFGAIPYTNADEEEIKWEFIIDTELPTVTFSPAAGSSGNGVDIDILLSFGEEVLLSEDGSDLDNDNVDDLIILREDDAEGIAIDFDATVTNGDETIITVSPTENFTSEQRVYVSIAAPGDLRDKAGNVMEQSDATFDIADIVAPDVTFTPANSATGVSPNSEITITLSEAVVNGDGTAITNANAGDLITLKSDNGSGSDIDFTATINDIKQVITVTPASNFESEQVVYVALDSEVEDEAGNELSGSLNATFTAATITAPAVEISVDESVVSPTSVSPISATVTFAEEVTGFTLSDISAVNADLSNFVEVGAGRIYTIDITPSARQVTVSIGSEVALSNLGIGNAASNNLSILYDSTAPMVTYDPREGEIDIPVDLSNIKIIFSKRVKKKTAAGVENITPDNLSDIITLKKATTAENADFDGVGGTSVDYTATIALVQLELDGCCWTAIGHRIQLYPEGDALDSKSDYYVAVNADKIVDFNDSELVNEFSSSTFSTVDNLPAQITQFRYVNDGEDSVDPHAPGERLTGVPTDIDLMMVFDEDVEMVEGNLTLFKKVVDGEDQEIGTISIPGDNVSGNHSQEITLTLDDPLESSVEYYIQLDAGSFMDGSDNEIEGIDDATTWNFVTRDEEPPEYVNHTPNPDDGEIFDLEDEEAIIEITFSEPVFEGDGEVLIYRDNGESLTWVETIDISEVEISDGSRTIQVSPENVQSGGIYRILIKAESDDGEGALVDASGNLMGDIGLLAEDVIVIHTTDIEGPAILGYSLTLNGEDEPTFFEADWDNLDAYAAPEDTVVVKIIARDIDLNSHIQIHFNEMLYSLSEPLRTIEDDDIGIVASFSRILGGVDTNMDFVGSISDDKKVVTLVPDEPLESAVGDLEHDYRIGVLESLQVGDENGNNISETTWVLFYTADVVLPEIESTSPESGETGVDPDTEIEIIFTERITAREGQLSVVATATGESHAEIDLVDGSFVIENQTLTIELEGSMESNTAYHILIDTEAIIDLEGNAYAGIDDPEVFEFITGDFDPPVVTFTPEHLSEHIGVDADLIIDFSEPITIDEDGGINDENVASLIAFESSPPYDQEQEEGDWEDVAFDAAINAAADTITLTLADDGDGNPTLLLGNRFYSMEIDEAIMDEAGNSIDPSPQFSRFLTAATDAPTVEVSTELSSPTNISPIAFTIEFSEAVTEFNSDSLTISGGEVASFSGEGTSYIVSITPSEGEVTLQVEGEKGFNEFDIGNAASNTVTLIYDSTPPTVTFSPADSTLGVAVDSKVYITFSEPVFTDDGDPTALGEFIDSVFVRKDSIDGEVQSFGMAYNDTTGVIKLTPPDSLISAADYYVAITAEVYDEAGNSFTGDSSYFMADDIEPPTVTLVPADGATDVAVDTYIRVIFSERVFSETGERFNESDVTEGMVVLREDNASGRILTINAQISLDTTGITIQADEWLNSEQTYYVQVNSHFSDINGTLVEGIFGTFTTADVIPPEITLDPEPGEKDVPLEAELSISFSESVRLMDNSVMTPNNVKDLLYVNLWNPEGEAIDFTVSVSAARDEITLSPSQAYPPYEKIVFGLKEGLEDYSDNLAGSAVGYFFTTGIPGFAIDPLSGITTTETGLSDTFEVALTSEPDAPVELSLMSSDVTEGMPYPTQLSFDKNNWNQARWVKVTGVDDPEADDDIIYHIKLFNVTSDDPDYDEFEADSVEAININDDPPGVQVYPISRLFTSEEGKQAQFGVVLLSRPTATVTIPVSTSDVTEASVDVTQLVFDAEDWDQKQLVTLTGLDDDEDDDDIEYKIVLGESVSEDADYSAVDPTDILAINIDDDVAGFALGYNRIVRTNEMGTDTVFTVKLNTEPAGTVALSVSSDDATEGTVSHDYLTFTPADWDVAQEITVTGVNDNLGDGNVRYNILVGKSIITASPAYGRLDAKEVNAVNLDREPQITTGSEFMSFDSSGIGILDSASVYVLNVGPDTLVIAGVSVNDSAFSTMFAPSPIKSGDSSLVRVFFNPEQAGKKQSVLYVEHNDPYQFPKELLISASVRDKSGPAIIELESMPTTAAVGEGVEVTVHVLDVTGVFDIGLYYGNGIGNFDFTKMTEDSSGIYSGNIPTGTADFTGLVYFIVATDTKGNITYSDTVSVPVQFGDKQLSTDVSGSAYPSGMSKDAWRLISVPNLIDENKATQIFGNELKDRNKRSWRLVSDFVSKETWQDVKEITPGMGMWLYQQVKENVSISTGAGTTSDLSRHELTVRSGWSIIGSPYAFTFTVDIDGEIFSGPFAYALDGVEGWSDVVTQFQPWAGYIIKNLTLEEQTLVLRPLASAGTDSTLKREIAGKQIGWTVNFAALSGRVGDLYNKIGRQPGASESIGPFDHAEPPIMPGGISLAFRQGNGRSLMYARDMRSMAEHNGTWPMDLMVKDIKEPISFTVELDEHYPLDLGLVILDHQTREVTDLKEDPDLKINHGNEDVPYRFTVVSGDGDYIIRKVEEILAGIPERFSLSQNYPNPFNSTTTIRYALPLPEFVNISIYNILGQEVHKMVGSWQEAGFHTARWDGRDLKGIPVSSGVYIYHIQAGKFMAARKMAIIK